MADPADPIDSVFNPEAQSEGPVTWSETRDSSEYFKPAKNQPELFNPEVFISSIMDQENAPAAADAREGLLHIDENGRLVYMYVATDANGEETNSAVDLTADLEKILTGDVLPGIPGASFSRSVLDDAKKTFDLAAATNGKNFQAEAGIIKQVRVGEGENARIYALHIVPDGDNGVQAYLISKEYAESLSANPEQSETILQFASYQTPDVLESAETPLSRVSDPAVAEVLKQMPPLPDPQAPQAGDGTVGERDATPPAGPEFREIDPLSVIASRMAVVQHNVTAQEALETLASAMNPEYDADEVDAKFLPFVTAKFGLKPEDEISLENVEHLKKMSVIGELYYRLHGDIEQMTAIMDDVTANPKGERALALKQIEDSIQQGFDQRQTAIRAAQSSQRKKEIQDAQLQQAQLAQEQLAARQKAWDEKEAFSPVEVLMQAQQAAKGAPLTVENAVNVLAHATNPGLQEGQSDPAFLRFMEEKYGMKPGDAVDLSDVDQRKNLTEATLLYRMNMGDAAAMAEILKIAHEKPDSEQAKTLSDVRQQIQQAYDAERAATQDNILKYGAIVGGAGLVGIKRLRTLEKNRREGLTSEVIKGRAALEKAEKVYKEDAAANDRAISRNEKSLDEEVAQRDAAKREMDNFKRDNPGEEVPERLTKKAAELEEKVESRMKKLHALEDERLNKFAKEKLRLDKWREELGVKQEKAKTDYAAGKNTEPEPVVEAAQATDANVAQRRAELDAEKGKQIDPGWQKEEPHKAYLNGREVELAAAEQRLASGGGSLAFEKTFLESRRAELEAFKATSLESWETQEGRDAYVAGREEELKKSQDAYEAKAAQEAANVTEPESQPAPKPAEPTLAEIEARLENIQKRQAKIKKEQGNVVEDLRKAKPLSDQHVLAEEKMRLLSDESRKLETEQKKLTGKRDELRQGRSLEETAAERVSSKKAVSPAKDKTAPIENIAENEIFKARLRKVEAVQAERQKFAERTAEIRKKLSEKGISSSEYETLSDELASQGRTEASLERQELAAKKALQDMMNDHAKKIDERLPEARYKEHQELKQQKRHMDSVERKIDGDPLYDEAVAKMKDRAPKINRRAGGVSADDVLALNLEDANGKPIDKARVTEIFDRMRAEKVIVEKNVGGNGALQVSPDAKGPKPRTSSRPTTTVSSEPVIVEPELTQAPRFTAVTSRMGGGWLKKFVSNTSYSSRVTGGAMGAWGVIQGGYGLKHSIETHDGWGVVLNSSNMAVGGGAMWSTMSKAAPAFLEGALTKINMPLTLATGVYQVYSEDGDFWNANADGSYKELGNKGERLAAVAGTTTAVIVAGAVGAVLLPATVAVSFVAVGGELWVDAHRAGRAIDAMREDNKSETHVHIGFGGGAKDNAGAPSVKNYTHLTNFILGQQMAKGMKGVPLAEWLNKLSYTKDPEALKVLRHDLEQAIAKQDKVIQENSTWVPDALRRWGDGLTNRINAEGEIAPLKGALAELNEYEKKLGESKQPAVVIAPVNAKRESASSRNPVAVAPVQPPVTAHAALMSKFQKAADSGKLSSDVAAQVRLGKREDGVLFSYDDLFNRAKTNENVSVTGAAGYIMVATKTAHGCEIKVYKGNAQGEYEVMGYQKSTIDKASLTTSDGKLKFDADMSSGKPALHIYEKVGVGKPGAGADGFALAGVKPAVASHDGDKSWSPKAPQTKNDFTASAAQPASREIAGSTGGPKMNPVKPS